MPSLRPIRHLSLVPPLEDRSHPSDFGTGPDASIGTTVPPMPALPRLDPVATAVAASIARRAWRDATRILGPEFGEPAFLLAVRFVQGGGPILSAARPRTWSAAIVWSVAEDAALIDARTGLTPRRLSDALMVSAQTLRLRVPQVRQIVDAWAAVRNVTDA